jgi:short-subunit dehydrogenase
LKSDLYNDNIKIQVINPGFVKTRLTDMNNFHMPSIISPEEAADNIIKTMETNKFESRFPFLFSNFIKSISMLPYSIYFHFVQIIKPKINSNKNTLL